MRFLPVVLLAASGALLAPAASDAATLPGTAIDGPSAAIKAFGDVDVAPDGTGGIVYIKSDSGKDHVFVARYANGAFGTPERVDTDPGIANKASFDARIAASNGGKLVVTFLNNDAAPYTAWSAIAPGTGQAFTDVAIDNTAIYKGIDIDANPDGVAYASGSSDNIDLRAYRLSAGAWTAVKAGAEPKLNFDPVAGDAGGGPGLDQSRIAVTADGNAVVDWPEVDATMKRKVYVRRITGTSAGTALEATIPALNGAPTVDFQLGVDIDVDATGAAYVLFREDFTYGGSNKGRILVRKLTGGTLSDAQVVDGLGDTPPEAGEFPRIDVNPSGQGLASVQRQLTFHEYAASLSNGTWTAAQADVNQPTAPGGGIPAIGDNGAGEVAWLYKPAAGTSTIVARKYVGGTAQPGEVTLSNPALGDPGIGIEAAADAKGNVVTGFVQGAAGNMAIVASVVDGPPPPTDTGNGGTGGNGGNGGTGGTGGNGGTGGTGGNGTGDQADKTAPLVSKLKLSPATFKKKGGTNISFKLTEDATVKFTVEIRTVRKHKVIYKKFGGFNFKGSKGTNNVNFGGKVGKKKLVVGKYRLTLEATDKSKNKSKAARATFTVKK